MKEHLFKLGALACLLGASSAHSQTLNWSSFAPSITVDSTGTALNETFLFQLGSFDASFVPTAYNVGEWMEYWHVFGSADYSVATGTFSGSQNVQLVDHYAAAGGDPPMFEGLKAYIWIRNTSSTEYFLASSVTWQFPTLDSGCCPNGNEQITTWSVSQMDTPIWGSSGNDHGAGDYDSTGGPYDIQTHAVPETTSAMLALFACGVALLRRSRS